LRQFENRYRSQNGPAVLKTASFTALAPLELQPAYTVGTLFAPKAIGVLSGVAASVLTNRKLVTEF
jgi:hypothetical protein